VVARHRWPLIASPSPWHLIFDRAPRRTICSYEEAKGKGRLRTLAELHEAIIHGAVKRVRPKTMTVMAAFMGLMPIMLSAGPGADVMKRIAAPMVGGLVTSFVMELLVYPAIYLLWRRRALAPRSDAALAA
jgi:Cu(I)/Ag(I) efflux system membrane protein CusA/SilA